MKTLKAIKTIDSLISTEEPNVVARIEELRRLQEGWLDGAGKALSSDGLDWFSAAFDEEYSTGLQRPYLYPTPEGNLLAEWPLGDNSCSLEIDLTSRQSEFHNLNLKSSEELTQSLNLDESEGWQLLVSLLNKFGR